MLMLIPTGFLGMATQLEACQSATIIGSATMVFILIFETWSFIKMVKNDRYFEDIHNGSSDSLKKLHAKFSIEENDSMV